MANPSEPLPRSAAEFARLARRVRSEAAVFALLDRVAREAAGHRSASRKRKGVPRAAESRQLRVFERRLLEITRSPRVLQTRGWELGSSVFESWSHLVALRSPHFAIRLKRWIGGRDPHVAALSAMHLAWMGRQSDLPLLRRLVRSGNPRMLYAVSHGARCYLRSASVGPRAAHVLARALTEYVTGVRVPRPGVRDEIDPYRRAFESILRLLLETLGRKKTKRLLAAPSGSMRQPRALRVAIGDLKLA